MQTVNQSENREFFSSGLGFVLAAAGSAVGLGNMWRFSYMAAEGGGAAFVLLYLLLTILIGIPIMATELAIGRKTRSSPINALIQIGGPKWSPAGLLMVLIPIIILAYFSVISGWSLHYVIDAVQGFSPSSTDRFESISKGAPAITFHLILMAITTFIVLNGVKKGIERMALILMPVMFIILIGLALWAATLEGGEEGYSFYLDTSLEAMLDPTVFRQAASQAFLSLSVGMGIMITYASYLPKKTGLIKSAAVISMADFYVAFISGLVVFPIIFAFGLSNEISGSSIGTLFISIPHAFQQLGQVGQLIGVAFFVVLAFAGVTSLVSLMEVGTASIMDRFKIGRKPAAFITAGFASIVGIFPALSHDILGTLDRIVGELLVILSVLAIALLGGWVMKGLKAELKEGENFFAKKGVTVIYSLIKYLVPVVLIVILIVAWSQ